MSRGVNAAGCSVKWVWYYLMTVIPEQVRQQLKDRFETVLTGPVHLTLYTRPGSSRLILPAGVGCPTCQDAREMAELLRDAAPEKITMDVVDVSRDEERALADGVPEVPTIALGSDSETGVSASRACRPVPSSPP